MSSFRMAGFVILMIGLALPSYAPAQSSEDTVLFTWNTKDQTYCTLYQTSSGHLILVSIDKSMGVTHRETWDPKDSTAIEVSLNLRNEHLISLGTKHDAVLYDVPNSSSNIPPLPESTVGFCFDLDDTATRDAVLKKLVELSGISKVFRDKEN